MRLNAEHLKKIAPALGVVVLIVVVMLYARRQSSAATSSGGGYISSPSAGDGGAAAAANAQVQSAELAAKTQAFGGLLDYQLGVKKITTDAATALGLAAQDTTKAFGLADRSNTLVTYQTGVAADLMKNQAAIDREVTLDAQGRSHIQNMAAIQLSYQLEQGKTNAAKSVAKHNIFAQLGGNIFKALVGFL